MSAVLSEGVQANILSTIGRTPLVELARMRDDGEGLVVAKCENQNPGGSVKDRPALAMIEAAERDGRLVPGRSVIVEPTSGNTGIGLALVGAVKGYKVVLTMPEMMSEERLALLRGYGAEIVLMQGDRMSVAVDEAARICKTKPDHVMLQQFQNPANPEVHRRTTGPEILAQLGSRKPDAFVAGVGTGGTITGVGEVLKERFPRMRVIAVEPAGSPVLSGGKPGPHLIQGIGAGFVPQVLNRALLDEVRQVSDHSAYTTKRALAAREGMLVGVSAGAAVATAKTIARELGPRSLVVTILPDTGERYLSLERFFRDL
jgi:cysteine synthase A